MGHFVLLSLIAVVGFLSIALTVFASIYVSRNFASVNNYTNPVLEQTNKGKALTIWLLLVALLQLIYAWFTAWYVYLT